MVHIYLYNSIYPVKSPVKADGKVWMTLTRSLESQDFFHIFLEH